METNSDVTSGDVFDSRDVIARIKELEALKPNLDEYDQGELEGLQSLAEEASNQFGKEWECGLGFICDDYFETYARDFAEDIGAISSDAQWPATCIDWDAAADALKMDYCSIDINGIEYWARA